MTNVAMMGTALSIMQTIWTRLMKLRRILILLGLSIGWLNAETVDIVRLTKQAKSGHLYDRGKAIASLGRSKDEKAIPVLLELMKSGSAGLRIQATEALAATGNQKALFEHLPGLLDDPSPSIRHTAAVILAGQTRTRDKAGLIAALSKCLTNDYQPVRRAAVGALVKLGAPGAKALVPALSDSSDSIRHQALRFLTKYTVPEALPSLIKLGTDKNPSTRSYVLQVLARIQEHEAFPVVEAGLSDPEASVRIQACRAAGGKWTEKKLGEKLKRLLTEDENEKVREAAAGALSSMGAEAQTDLLLSALYKGEGQSVRVRAIGVIGGIGNATALPFLKLLDTDSDSKVADAATKARSAVRARLEKNKIPFEERPLTISSSVPVTESLLRNETPLLRLTAAQTAGKLSVSGEKRSRLVGSLLKAMQDSNSFVRKAASHAAGRLLESASSADRKLLERMVKQKDVRIRIAAMKALSNILGLDSVSFLSRTLKDRDESVREAAAEQFRKIAERGDDKEKSKLADAAADALVKALSDSSVAVRYQARGALRMLADLDFRFDVGRWAGWAKSRSNAKAKVLPLHPVEGILREEIDFQPAGRLLLPFGSPSDVAVKGKNAFVATGEGGVALFDISKPASPILIDRYVTRVPGRVTEGHGWARYANAVCHRLALTGNRLYFLANTSGFSVSGQELGVLDVSKAGRLRVLGSLPPISFAHGHLDIAAAGNFVYSLQGKTRNSIVVYDFTDPERPAKKGSYTSPNPITAFAAAGKFVVLGTDKIGLRVLDVSNPESPQARDAWQVKGKVTAVLARGSVVVAGTDQKELLVLKLKGDTLAEPRSIVLDSAATSLASGSKEIYVRTASGIRILDISKPAQPKLLPGSNNIKGGRMAVTQSGVITVDGSFGIRLAARNANALKAQGEALSVGDVRDLEVREGRALVAAGQAGLLVADLGKPEKPTLVSRLPLDGFAYRVVSRDKLAFVSAGVGGLAVVDVSDSKAPKLVSKFSVPGLLGLVTSSLLRGSDIRDWTGLASQIEKAGSEKEPSPSQHVWKLLPAQTKKTLSAIAKTKAFDRKTQAEVTAALNALIRRKDFYNPAQFKGMDLSKVKGVPEPVRQLCKRKAEQLSEREVEALNRFLLEATFGQIAKNSFYQAQVRDVFLVGDIAWLAVDPIGLVAVDVSEPAEPRPIGFFRLTDERARARAVHVQYGVAFLACGRAGLYSLDVSDPKKPKQLGWLWDHDGHRRMATWDVFVKGGRAYLADADLGLLIVDVIDPKSLKLVGRFHTGNSHRVVLRGSMAFMADGGYGLRAIDVSDATRPKHRGSFHHERVMFQSLAFLDEETAAVAGTWELRTFKIGTKKIPLRTAFALKKNGLPSRMLGADGKPVDPEQAASRYGIDFTFLDGDRIVCSEGYPDFNNPGQTTKPVYQDLSNAAGWPNVRVKVGTVAIDPKLGRVKFADGDREPSRLTGWEPLPMGICHSLRIQGKHVFMSDEEGWNIVIFDASDPFKPKRVGLAATGGFCIGSLWVHGDVAIGGNNMGRFNVFDISNIARPEPVGTFPGNGRCVVASGNYAFDVSGRPAAWDISDPRHPVKVAEFPKGSISFGITGSHANPQVIATDKYIIGSGGAGLRVVDLADMPIMKILADHPIHVKCLALGGNKLYVGDGGSVRIFDFSDPKRPVLLGRCPLPSGFNAIAVDGNWLYTAGSSIQVVDVSDPANPRFTGSCGQLNFITGNTAQNTVHAVVANGNAVYTAQPGWGLAVFDVTDKTNPKALVGDPLNTLAMGGDFTGIAVRGNYAFSANNWSGVKVVDISNPSKPRHIFNTKLFDSGASLGVAASDDLFTYHSSVTGTMIFDYSDPSKIVEMSHQGPRPIPPPGWGNGGGRYMCIRGNYAYGGGNVLDITNPMKVKVVGKSGGSLKMGLAGTRLFTSRKAIDVSRPDQPTEFSSNVEALQGGSPWYGRGFYATEEIAYTASRAALLITDVRDPTKPKLLSHRALPHLVCDVSVQGDFAYVSTYYGGVEIVDVSDPARPKLVDHFEYGPFWDFGGWDNLCCYQSAAIDGEVLCANEYYSGLHVIDVPTAPRPPKGKLRARVFVK